MNFYFEYNYQTGTLMPFTKITQLYFGLMLLTAFAYFATQGISSAVNRTPLKMIPLPLVEAATSSPQGAPLNYSFNSDGVLQEAGSMHESSSPYFWLNSGGMLNIDNGVGRTNQGALGPFNFWRILYGTTNPLDTDGGKYPQNIFRLVTKGSWNNVVQSAHFNINGLHTTNTPNRDGYSGVLLMSRYRDGMNLYYAGIRQDGTAVIKKKYKGTYYTLASSEVFPSAIPYNRDTNPNLIPTNVWMGLKTKTVTQSDGSVVVTLWIDKNGNNNWQQLLMATDVPGKNGDQVITGPAHTGIRTDYLDVLFDDYKVTED